MVLSGNLTWLLELAIEIVDLSIKNDRSFHRLLTFTRGYMFLPPFKW